MKHLAFSALFLVGCAATAYQAVDGNGFGYSERIQDDGNVAVAFVGNEHTGLPRARRFAVCRASEVVAGMGRPLFSVVTESTGMGAVGAVAQCHGSACVSEVVGKQLGGEIGFFFELDRSARQVARFWSADRPPGLFAHLITVKGSCLFVNLKIPLLPIKNVRN